MNLSNLIPQLTYMQCHFSRLHRRQRDVNIYCFFHPQDKVGRKPLAALFLAEIRVSKTRLR